MKIKYLQLNFHLWTIGTATLILFIASSLRHALFQSAQDLSFFDHVIYLVSQGLPPISSMNGVHILGDHAAFILYPLALLYKLYADVHWLLAIQAIALALGSIPIYALSLQTGLSVAYARAIAIGYLLYPALFNVNFFSDFCPETIAVPALLWATWAGIKGRTSQLIIAIALVLICKDRFSLTVIALGVWLWLSKKRRNYGLGCIAAGSAWFVATIVYLVPKLRGGQPTGMDHFSSFGNSFSEIAWKVITDPSMFFGRFLLPDRLFYYLLLILPVIIGLSWRQILTMLPALPMLLINILADYAPQRDLVHHYTLPIFPFCLVWLVSSLDDFQQKKKREWLKPRVLIIWALICFLALARYEFFWTRYLSTLSNIQSVRTAVSLVKTQASVLTTVTITPHLSHRPIIKYIDDTTNLAQIKSESFEYVLIDLQHPRMSQELASSLVAQLQKEPDFQLRYANEQVFLFEKIVHQ